MQNKVLYFLYFSHEKSRKCGFRLDNQFILDLKKIPFLELSAFGSSWKRYHITNICHTSYKLHHSFKAQPEP